MRRREGLAGLEGGSVVSRHTCQSDKEGEGERDWFKSREGGWGGRSEVREGERESPYRGMVDCS